MSIEKPKIPKGTRDFGPEEMVKRDFIFTTIKNVFKKYGYLPIETPSMENLSVLTGKYGEEGDQLLYKILNSGDFLSKVNQDDIGKGSKNLTPKIAEKGLRYDLTVPFARYVVMNQHQITFPFRRYQIQPVWRADRPQKGRYREFYQCDADVVGTDALVCEAEIVAIIDEVLDNLKITDYSINVNNRKILTGITQVINAKGKETDFCVAIDKLDKIGKENVLNELLERGFSENSINKLEPFFNIRGSNKEKTDQMKEFLSESETGMKGLMEMEEVFELVENLNVNNSNFNFDVTLARGLSYYTGAIFEVKVKNVSIGSVGGGGRYDNLTGVFGLPGMSGVGFSFGVDRLYDVMEALNLFEENKKTTTQVLIVHFDRTSFLHGLSLLSQLRKEGINSEIYPESIKLKKQLTYANKNAIPYVLVVGSEEVKTRKYAFKQMITGEQYTVSLPDIINNVKLKLNE